MGYLTSVKRAREFTIKRETDKITDGKQEKYMLKQKKAKFQEQKLKKLGENEIQTKLRLKQ